jgi:hypothetical protein
MRSLDDRFQELCGLLKHGRSLSSMGTEPVFYLVYPPSELLAVKGRVNAWKGRLTNEGWDVTTFSLTEMLESFLKDHPDYAVLRDHEQALRESLSVQELLGHQHELARNLQAIVQVDGRPNPKLLAPLLRALEESNSRPRGLLLLTDVEGIHPFMRVNTIEHELNGKVRHPVVVLYPGIRHGQTALSFLGIYPADLNYRSEHVG